MQSSLVTIVTEVNACIKEHFSIVQYLFTSHNLISYRTIEQNYVSQYLHLNSFQLHIFEHSRKMPTLLHFCLVHVFQVFGFYNQSVSCGSYNRLKTFFQTSIVYYCLVKFCQFFKTSLLFTIVQTSVNSLKLFHCLLFLFRHVNSSKLLYSLPLFRHLSTLQNSSSVYYYSDI